VKESVTSGMNFTCMEGGSDYSSVATVASARAPENSHEIAGVAKTVPVHFSV